MPLYNSTSYGYTTTATAAGTTTLTAISTRQQFFTGSTTQTVVLPVTSTLVLGQSFLIVNLSSGIVTVQSSGANTIQAMAANTQLLVTCILTSGTGTASWNGTYQATTLTAPVNPTIQKFTSGSGTYTTPTGVQYIRVRMVGGGGGGGGSGTGSIGNGGTGGNTTFGTTLLVANGGTGAAANAVIGGTGGSASLGSGPIGTALSGANGGTGCAGGLTTVAGGGTGGVSPFGGAGTGNYAGAGVAAISNTGSGGGGSGPTANTASAFAGAGGGAAGFVDAIITSPLAIYSYAVGAAGTAGTAGTSGSAGGAGGSGYIEVTEYYPYLQFSLTSGALPVANGGTGVTTSNLARYTSAAGQSITAGPDIVDFGTSVYDTNTLVTTGASWKFTAKVDGKYSVKVRVLFANLSWTAGTRVQMQLFKNGSAYSILSRDVIWVTGTWLPQAVGSDDIDLVATDFIDIRLGQNEGSNRALDTGSATNTHIAIARIG